MTLIGLEPSEILTIHDEGPALIKERSLRKKLESVAKKVVLFDEFMADNNDAIRTKILEPVKISDRILVHGHCHQKSLIGMDASLKMLSAIPDMNITVIPSGCCGMAGAFGYEQEHYQVSQDIAELVLFPAIRNADENTLIVANGASCRQQIYNGLNRRAYHSAEILAMAINK